MERNRRTFLSRDVPAMLLLPLLAACGGSVAPTTAPRPRLETPAPRPVEISGVFPETNPPFTQLLRQAGLIPRVLPEQAKPEDYTRAGLEYLERVLKVLEQVPEARESLQKFGDPFGVDSSTNDIAPDETLIGLLRTMIEDIGKKIIVFLPDTSPHPDALYATQRVLGDTTLDKLGIIHNIYFHPTMALNQQIVEPGGRFYKRYSDAQIALKLLHEYIHTRQGRGAFRVVLERFKETLRDHPSPAQEVINLMDDLDQQDQERLNALRNHKEVTNTVPFYEAQANVASQLLLYCLRQLNGGNRIPGIEDDPYGAVDSLFIRFTEAILGNRNTFDSNWLNAHLR